MTSHTTRVIIAARTAQAAATLLIVSVGFGVVAAHGAIEVIRAAVALVAAAAVIACARSAARSARILRQMERG